MAVAGQDLEPDTKRDETDDQSGRATNKILVWGGVGLVATTLLVGGSVMATLMFAGSAQDASMDVRAIGQRGSHPREDGLDTETRAKKDTYYFPLDPPFVVNFGDESPARFLQVTLEVSSRREQSLENVQKHMPAIRHNIVFLLSSQDYEIVKTREGKEKLRADLLSEIQKILKNRTGHVGVDDIYFTSFVMQ